MNEFECRFVIIHINFKFSFDFISVFLLAYYIVAVWSFLTIRKPFETRARHGTPAAAPTTSENIDPIHPLVA